MRICDRCGKKATQEIALARIKSSIIFEIQGNYDLCKNCLKDLKRWLKGKPFWVESRQGDKKW